MRVLVILALLLTAIATPRAAADQPRDLSGVLLQEGRPLLGAPHERTWVERFIASSLRASEVLPVAMTAAPRLITGNAGYAVPSLGRDYLAMRLPRGTHVLIVGPGGSWQAIVNDWGPSSHIRPARVADIAVGHWTHVCGLPSSAGLCRVQVYVGGHEAHPTPHRTAPPTDVGP